jgi:hypothetical protein
MGRARNHLFCLISIGIVAGVSLPVAANAGSAVRPSESAARYMASIVKEKLKGEYALAWQTLYPRHQDVASLDAYVGCESLIPSPGKLLGVRIVRTFREKIWIAGESRAAVTKAVRVRVRVASTLFQAFPVVISQTFHAVRIGRHWTWILSPDQYAYYSAGTCPYA